VRWVVANYIVIHVDVRGAGASPGVLDPLSPRETEDYAIAITWAARQPRSSGKAGLLGTSFLAINQYSGEARKRAMSRAGDSPKWRRYSRLNCDGLS
jgi:uncharacterized protein